MTITISLEKSQALKEAGYPQEGHEFYFYYDIFPAGRWRWFHISEFPGHTHYQYDYFLKNEPERIIADPTVSDMKDWLIAKQFQVGIYIHLDGTANIMIYNGELEHKVMAKDTLENALSDACLWVLKGEGK